VTTNPPMQSRRTEQDIAASRSLRNESHGSGGRLEDGMFHDVVEMIDDVIEMIDGEIGEQIPMLGQRGSMLAQPLPLGASHRLPAERSLGGETRRLQLADSLSERSGKACVSFFPGGLTGKSNHESKAVLSVVEPGIPCEPVPIQFRVRDR